MKIFCVCSVLAIVMVWFGFAILLFATGNVIAGSILMVAAFVSVRLAVSTFGKFALIDDIKEPLNK